MIKRRKKSNPDKSFEDACAENNIALIKRDSTRVGIYGCFNGEKLARVKKGKRQK